MRNAKTAATVAGAAAAFWLPVMLMPTPAALVVFIGETVAAAVLFAR